MENSIPTQLPFDPLATTIKLTLQVDQIQARKRLRLVDRDDIGEFVQEVARLIPYGVTWLRFVGSCPDGVANSYKGSCESTILRFWIDKEGRPQVEAKREQRFSKFRFQAAAPPEAPMKTLGYTNKQTGGYWAR